MALTRLHKCPTSACGQESCCGQTVRMYRHIRAFADSRMSLKLSRYDKLLLDRRDLNAYHGEAIVNKHIEHMHLDFCNLIKQIQLLNKIYLWDKKTRLIFRKNPRELLYVSCIFAVVPSVKIKNFVMGTPPPRTQVA